MFRACLFGVLILNSAESAEPPKQPAYHLPLPSGWRKESFTLPPDFAPDMKWKGSEELRFAPGMFKASAPDFFSYAMLFRLPEDAKIDAKTLERELLAYYRGLCSAVSKSKKREVDTKGFTVTITAAKQQPDKRPDSEAVAGYMGELSWIEPFATAKHQTVHLDIQSWVSGSKHRCIFICASAQPESAPVWKILREIRAGCTCQ